MWDHIVNYFLLDYLINSLILIVGCGAMTFLIGVSSAWIVSKHEFKGRKTFEWLLFMPLSIPSYIMAYCYVGMLGNGGTLIRVFNLFGINIQKIEMMNIVGLIWILSFSLFPYVYAADVPRLWVDS
jgi:iron(III) transport system permease protein